MGRTGLGGGGGADRAPGDGHRRQDAADESEDGSGGQRAGGDYVFPIKHDQERTHRALALWFAAPPPVGMPPNRVAEQAEKAHGRLIRRRLEATTVLNDYLDWPALGQAFQLTRDRIDLTTGEIDAEVVFGITSLSPAQARPADMLTISRRHWTIENRIHWVRDVTFDEDRLPLRVGHTHQMMAAIRNLAIGLLRIHGRSAIASALRAKAACPDRAYSPLAAPLRE